ncbi:hypothetical protein SZ55_1216 [Pseudomonas sp. FeS53a]|jgi:hypothetical protein|uniref:caspase family protein n=1 Tax=Pseudomonas sp. FeS53a TaxID=1604022 RepID=UPI0005DFC5D1|nr:caspase family protein [Pseudomonas sp. FeS53a]KIV73792.1 hypothetical protein SZ55_1216 [Pseudomonas sp. FeS53a]
MKRYGLVIGNSAYLNHPLDNATNDAEAVHRALKERGFDSLLICNATCEAMTEAITIIKRKLNPGDLFFYFFAGHAYEHLGHGYLLPIDITEFTAGAINFSAYTVNELLQETQDLELTRVIVLDACRVAFNESDISARTINESIHEIRARNERKQGNLLLSYSTSYGDVALDGQESNSRFTKYLTRLLLNHKLSIEEMFKEIGCSVIRDTENRQRPWFYSSLEADIKISDLPIYQQRHSFYTPVSSNLHALAGSRNKENLLLIGNSGNIQFLNSPGPNGKLKFKGGVRAACISNSGEISFLDQKGSLIIPNLNKEIDLGGVDPIGITTSNDGKFILVYGLQEYVIFHKKADSCEPIYADYCRPKWFYCAEFINDTEVWISGDCQEIHVVRLGSSKVEARKIQLPFHDYIYAISHYKGDLVLLSTSHGKIYMINKVSEVAGLIMGLGESVRLPSSRRSNLLNCSDDEIISNFLFSPKNLKKSDLRFLKGAIETNNLLYLTRASSIPIIAIGSSEGIITIIDTRNWDAYQQLDASGGRETELTGLAFTADDTLVATTKDNHALFYTPINEGYLVSLAYVDSLE